MLWSILMPTLNARWPRANMIQASLIAEQAARYGDVEFLVLGDSGCRSVGMKSNVLMLAAQGDYISFVADDDMVSAHYVDELREQLLRGPDLVTFDFMQIRPGEEVQTHHLGWRDFSKGSVRQAHPMACWRRDLVPLFKDSSQGEDLEWGRRAAARLAAMTSPVILHVDKILYTYLDRKEARE